MYIFSTIAPYSYTYLLTEVLIACFCFRSTFRYCTQPVDELGLYLPLIHCVSGHTASTDKFNDILSQRCADFDNFSPPSICISAKIPFLSELLTDGLAVYISQPKSNWSGSTDICCPQA